MARRLDLRHAPAYRPDDNVASYRPDDDGRSGSGERVRYVPLRLIHPSRHQTRVHSDPEADRLLAEDIDEHGLLHYPVVRPHPNRPGEFETTVGHRRIAAVRLLARQGRGARVLRKDGDQPENWSIPVIVRELDDITAQIMTVAENMVREDLRPWEQAVALERLRSALEERGERASVRGLAAHLEASHQTIAPYLKIGRALTPDVLRAAGLALREGRGEGAYRADESLCALSLAALERAARPKDPSERARVLQAELEKAGARPRSHDVTQTPGATDPGPRRDLPDALQRGIQINVRRPIGTLSPDEARRCLLRLAPSLGALVEVASPKCCQLHITLGNGCVLSMNVAPSGDVDLPGPQDRS